MKRSSLARFWGLAAVAVSVAALSGCGEPIGPEGAAPPAGGSATSTSSASAASSEHPWAKVEESKYVTTPSGLKYAILKPGDGAVAKAGDMVQVHYTGWLQSNGKKFDSSRDRGEPIGFPLGRGGVIPGWDEGVAGMKIGEQRQLVIPAKLGYGDQGAGEDIPPGATLVFDVELVKIGQ